MIVDLGFGILVITLVVTLYASVAAIVGVSTKDQRWIDSARYASLITFGLITLAAGCIIYLIVTGHYEVSYVYAVSSSSMPFYLKLTALWGGQSGSLIFWSWLMSALVRSSVCENFIPSSLSLLPTKCTVIDSISICSVVSIKKRKWCVIYKKSIYYWKPEDRSRRSEARSRKVKSED